MGKVLLLLLVVGCSIPPGAPDAPLPKTSIAACSADTKLPKQADLCDGRFTAEGLPCWRCPVATGCFLPSVVVYCAPSCNDRLCAAVAAGKRRR